MQTEFLNPIKILGLKDVDSHTVHYGHIVDGDKIIDQVLVIVLKNHILIPGKIRWKLIATAECLYLKRY